MKSPYYQKCLSLWFRYYEIKTGSNFIMDGKQGKHLRLLIKKIECKVVEIGMEPNEENIINSFMGFLNRIEDRWTLDHLEISLLNSKFNILYVSAIKNSPLGIREAIAREAQKYSSQ